MKKLIDPVVKKLEVNEKFLKLNNALAQASLEARWKVWRESIEQWEIEKGEKE